MYQLRNEIITIGNEYWEEQSGLISIVRMFLHLLSNSTVEVLSMSRGIDNDGVTKRWLSPLIIHGSLNPLVDYGLVPHNSSCSLLGCWLLLHAVCLTYQINDLN